MLFLAGCCLKSTDDVLCMRPACSAHGRVWSHSDKASLLMQPAEWMMSGTLGALAVVAAAVVRIYLGWSYVGNRLLSAAVEYEETGWSVSVSCLAGLTHLCKRSCLSASSIAQQQVVHMHLTSILCFYSPSAHCFSLFYVAGRLLTQYWMTCSTSHAKQLC